MDLDKSKIISSGLLATGLIGAMVVYNWRIGVNADPDPLVVFLFGALLSYIAIYFKSYAEKLGVDNAALESIKELTKAQEKVKDEFSTKLENLKSENALANQELAEKHQEILEMFKAKNQLALAALDKRLEVHQEAFIFFFDLTMKLHPASDSEFDSFLDAALRFFIENQIYFTPLSSNAFRKMLRATTAYRNLNVANPAPPERDKDMEKQLKQILNCGKLLVTEMGLPSPNLDQLKPK